VSKGGAGSENTAPVPSAPQRLLRETLFYALPGIGDLEAAVDLVEYPLQRMKPRIY
jgi:hypothetical protein